VRAVGTLLLANARYWSTVAPLVRAQLRRWERRARTIPDRDSRHLALEKLQRERFNAEVAATFATFVPRSRRARVVEALVALEVLYDFLDGLIAGSPADPLADGERTFEPFLDAITLAAERGAARQPADQYADGGYTAALAGVVRQTLERLPAAAEISDLILGAACRTAQGQIRTHAVRSRGLAQLERWARREALGTELEWVEFAAGAAASVLAMHALITAAADRRTTRAQARAIDAAYLSISAVSTMLDSLNDYERDRATGRPMAIDWYQEGRMREGDRVAHLAARALTGAAALPRRTRHIVIAAGVVSYYTSPAEARTARARPVAVHIHRALGGLIWPTLAMMRGWRMAKRVRASRSRPRARLPAVPSGARLARQQPKLLAQAPIEGIAGELRDGANVVLEVRPQRGAGGELTGIATVHGELQGVS
jgi:tetraprenyl-beta-curcumene synthase